MYDPDDFVSPEAFRRQDWVAPPYVEGVFEERRSGTANLAGMFTLEITERQAREAQALTAGMITCLDDAIGLVTESLSRSGASADTVRCFTADHGDHLGNHRLLFKGAEQYRDILRVPFIWSDPMTERVPERTNALASTKDIPATILARGSRPLRWDARQEPRANHQGRRGGGSGQHPGPI